MGKKKSRQNQVNGVAEKTEEKMPDRWSSIENDGLKSARQSFYKEPVESRPKTKHYEKFKNMPKRRSDGLAAERVDFHQQGNGTKRPNAENVTARKRPREEDGFHLYEDEGEAILDGPTKKSKKLENGVKDKAKKNKRERKEVQKRVSVDMSESYIVEEPEEAVSLPVQKGSKSQSIRFANLFDDETAGDGQEFMAFADDDYFGSDEEYEEEEVSDEDDFEGLEDEDEIEDEEVDAEEMRLDPNDIAEIVEDDEEYASPVSEDELEDEDEDDEDEEVMDEEDHDHCSSCSEVSEQDAESDEEGNLGEERTATVVQKTNKSTPVNLSEFPFSDEDSSVTATRALAWMISSCDVQTFFSDFYQQNCLVIQRQQPNYYGNLFSTQRLADLLEKNYVEYGVNINVAEYRNSIRITPNGTGRAFPREIKAHIKHGRSIQLTNPQAFDDQIWYLCEILQEAFGCFVGANTYFTPAGSAGFAPHWDDIDAFLLQLEGRKYWKVYAPESNEDELPRESSGNFTEADMKRRKPAFEGWVEQGDLLYIPRGFIHQAHTDKKVHSLHVTVSTGRQWTFADVMDKLLPEAITSLADERMKMRRGLPVGLLDMNGVADYKYKMDEYFVEKFVAPLDRHMSMLRNFVSDTCLESAVDLMAREFMKTALPPVITPAERKFHVMGQAGENLLVGNPIPFLPDNQVRLMRRHGQRLVFETEDKCFIAHRISNSRLYEGREEQTIDLDIKFVPALTTLLDHYPEWTKVEELPDLTHADRRAFCQLLYDNGIILAKSIPSKKNKK